jgi:sugar O-acyltransferase (sialic acid O-acetyltransferase NeuD family)
VPDVEEDMNGLVVFGTGDIAELAAYLFELDFDRRVDAFTVDDDYVDSPEFFGRPVVPSSQLLDRFPPDRYDLFVGLAYGSVNRLRAEKCSWARSLGYALPSYISPRATTFPTFEHGDNCFVFEDNTIQPFATIGNNVTLWSGNHIGHHSTIEDDVFIASHVVVSGGVVVKRGTFIGVNATLRDHITIGEHCVVGAGAVLLADAPDESVFRATPTEPWRRKSSELRRI